METAVRLVALVGRAMESGGWLPITFHRVCEAGCSPIGITPELLTEFADYLQGEVAAGRLGVETIGEVVGGDAAPVREDWDRGRLVFSPADRQAFETESFGIFGRRSGLATERVQAALAARAAAGGRTLVLADLEPVARRGAWTGAGRSACRST